MTITDIERRPKRTNQGQGGVGHQLAELEKKLRPDLQPQAAKKSKAVVNIPDSAPTNRMAPQAPEKAVKAKRAIPTKVRMMLEHVTMLTYFPQRSCLSCVRKTLHWAMVLRSHHNTRSQQKVLDLASNLVLYLQRNVCQ